MCLGYPEKKVEGYIDAVRRSHYDLSTSTDAEHSALEEMRVKQVRRNRLSLVENVYEIERVAHEGKTIASSYRAQGRTTLSEVLSATREPDIEGAALARGALSSDVATKFLH